MTSEIEERVQMVTRIGAAFWSREMPEETIAIYVSETADVPLPVLGQAVKDAIRSQTFAPAIGEIRKSAVILSGEHRDLAGSFAVITKFLASEESADSLDPFIRQVYDAADYWLLSKSDQETAYRHWQKCWEATLQVVVSSDLRAHPAITAGAAERLAIA